MESVTLPFPVIDCQARDKLAYQPRWCLSMSWIIPFSAYLESQQRQRVTPIQFLHVWVHVQLNPLTSFRFGAPLLSNSTKQRYMKDILDEMSQRRVITLDL